MDSQHQSILDNSSTPTPGDGGFMSLQSTVCRPTAAPASPAPRLPGSRPNPAHTLAHGRLYRASDLIAQGDADDDTALFERSYGPAGTDHVGHHDVDFFCSPRVRARLELALLQAQVGKAMEGGAA